ncbi:hypothetical protein EV363DRAFT_1259212 [Boletus edulis]|nr:hypothetical protein EV363DRAFT_1259212 [Boletus edulis]
MKTEIRTSIFFAYPEDRHLHGAHGQVGLCGLRRWHEAQGIKGNGFRLVDSRKLSRYLHLCSSSIYISTTLNTKPESDSATGQWALSPSRTILLLTSTSVSLERGIPGMTLEVSRSTPLSLGILKSGRENGGRLPLFAGMSTESRNPSLSSLTIVTLSTEAVLGIAP